MNPSKLMKDLGLGQHVGALESIGISEELLPYVTARDLASAGIAEEDHAPILAAIEAAKEPPVAAPPPPAASPQPAPRSPEPRSRVLDAPPPKPVMETNPFQAPLEPSDSFSAWEHRNLYEDAPLGARGSRLAARIVDNVATAVGAIPGILIVCAGGTEEIVVLALLVMIVGVFGVVFYNWYLTATEGRTIGKRALGLRIVKVDGSPVDFVSGVIMRTWVLGFITGLANLFYLGPIVSLIDTLLIFAEDRRCLHDHIAGTKVVIG